MARLTKKRYAIIGAVSVVALTGGIAFAYWTSTGTDTDTGTTGTENAWSVDIDNASIDTTGVLKPGSGTDHITFTVKNNESGTKQVEVGQLSVDVTSVAPATCLAADFNLTNKTVPTGVNVASGASVSGSFDVQLTNTSVNQNACKGAVVSYTVAIN